jgi:hypothetical protein
MRRHAFRLLAALGLFACAKSLSSLAPFACAEDRTCPSGFECNSSRECVATSAGGSSSASSSGSSASSTSTVSTSSSSSSGTCPSNLAFTPIAWAPPTPLHQGLCTSAQVTAWWNSLNPTTAQIGTSGSASCDACIATAEGSASYGPVITTVQGGVTVPAQVNFGGCIANEDGQSFGGSCGNQASSFLGCLDVECDQCSDFDSTNQSSSGPTQTCYGTVEGSGAVCAGYLLSSSCEDEIEQDGGVDEPCVVVTGEQLTELWCGEGGDAGVDAAADAGSTFGTPCNPGGTTCTGMYDQCALIESQYICTRSCSLPGQEDPSECPSPPTDGVCGSTDYCM